MSALRILGALALLFARTLSSVATRGVSLRATAEQLAVFGTSSLWLVLTGMTFFGAAMLSIADDQARKITGNVLILGAPYFELLVREFGPLTVALLTASRVGAGAAAELAAASVNEQAEALVLSAGDPLAEWVAPRLLAGMIGLPLLTIVGTLAGAMSAAGFATVVLGVDGRAFLDPQLVSSMDVWSAAAKAAGCGLLIPLCAAWAGLSASGGAPAVGRATTSGVVTASIGCLTLDLLLSFAFGAAS